jgi:hypothetical protein
MTTDSYLYHRAQERFQSALKDCPVSLEDRVQFDNLFEQDAHTGLVQIGHINIQQAAQMARRAEAWSPAYEYTLMHTLWKTIHHREEAAKWYARMDAEGGGGGGHRHIVRVFKAAWSILNNGVVYDPQSPPTARPGAA